MKTLIKSIRRIPPWVVQWLETIAITFLVLAGGYYFNGKDPFLVTARFPWLWFAPILAALRYGMGPGLASVSIIALLMFLADRTGVLPYPFPLDHMLGGLLLTMICGQFGSVWRKRLKRADMLSEHALERAQQISRAYFMVRVSHDRLEQNLISKPLTLRQAMVDMRLFLMRHGGEIDGEVAGELLSLLSHYCSLDSASIYLVEDGRLSSTPVASIGKGAPYEPEDLLLRAAMESDGTAYQSVEKMSVEQHSSYLVASPMRSSSGDLLAVLLVSEMPFLALQRETLQILGVLLSYCVEHAAATVKAAEILEVFPGCPPIFASELIKMHRLNRELGIESTLGLLRVNPNARQEEMALTMEKKQRGLDHVWRLPTPQGILLITLMPFSNITGGEGYLTRVSKFVRTRFGMRLGDELITSRLLQIVPTVSPLGHLRELLKLEGIDGESQVPAVHAAD